MGKYRKGLVAVAGALASAVAAGLIPDPWNKWAMVALAAGTALGVYGVPNDRPPFTPVHGSDNEAW